VEHVSRTRRCNIVRATRATSSGESSPKYPLSVGVEQAGTTSCPECWVEVRSRTAKDFFVDGTEVILSKVSTLTLSLVPSTKRTGTYTTAVPALYAGHGDYCITFASCSIRVSMSKIDLSSMLHTVP
jgi:hypothetical protein